MYARQSSYLTFQLAFLPLLPTLQVASRDDVSELLALDNYVDLVVPRGSNELVRTIKEQSRSIPVLGHADGICHVYIDADADVEKALKVGKYRFWIDDDNETCEWTF